MIKREILNLRRILMINAFVKFNLIPSVDSPDWNEHADRYKGMYIHLLPSSRMTDENEGLIMTQLGKASAAKTPDQKFNLYRTLCQITGYTLEQIACPILHKLNTIQGKVSYTLFVNPDTRVTDDHPLINEISEWEKFYNLLPKFYFWDTHEFKPPFPTSVIVAALCLDLQRPLTEAEELSCLFALADTLGRHDILEQLQVHNINAKALRDNTKILYEQLKQSSQPVAESSALEMLNN